MGKETVQRTLPSRVRDCLLVAYAHSAPKTSVLPCTDEPCCPAERGAGRRPGGHRLRTRRRQCCQPLGRTSSRSGTSWLESRDPAHICRRQVSRDYPTFECPAPRAQSRTWTVVSLVASHTRMYLTFPPMRSWPRPCCHSTTSPASCSFELRGNSSEMPWNDETSFTSSGDS